MREQLFYLFLLISLILQCGKHLHNDFLYICKLLKNYYYYIIISYVVQIFIMEMKFMKEEIESLRENLHELLEIDKCLCSNEIVKLSQELDKLIYAYYSCTAEV